jgi:transposase
MTKQTRRKFNGDFKAKVVIEALKERSTVEELARKYEVHPTQINTWKREFLSKAAQVFEERDSGLKETEANTEKLYAQIGQLKVENDYLKKKLL